MGLGRVGFKAAVSAAAIMMGASGALAGAFGIREQSAIGLGLEFAGAAAGSAGLSSMFWNPATITMHPGWSSEYNVSYIAPSSTITPVAPTPTLAFGPSGDIGEQGGLVPASYTAYQLTDQLWIGLAASAPYGLITKPNDVWAGQVYSRSSRVFSADFNPILGWKVNDWLSIAGGPVIQYFKTSLKSAAGVLPTASSVILKGDSIGFGYTIGATITPIAGTDIGIGYRSSVNQQLEGSLQSPTTGWLPARVNLNLPDKVTVGLRQRVTDQLNLDFGFEWTNWSRLNIPGVVSPALGRVVTAVPLGYKDAYFYSVGAEYQWDPRWAFRLGVAYEQSPIDISNRSTRLPDTDRVHVGVGATYQWSEKLAVSASYSHIFSVGSNNGIRLTAGNVGYDYGPRLPFIATTETSADIVSVALNYRWDNPPVVERAPIIRKY